VQDFIKHFVREPAGSWRCVSFVEIPTHMGRIQVPEGTRFMPGTIFMGVDIVKLLEQERQHQL
jgi:hypothetical protein